MKAVKIIIAAAAALAAVPVHGQVSASADRFSPLPAGYIERARAMRDAGNYNGVIDQLRILNTSRTPLSAAELEEYTFLLAEAYYNSNDADCIRLLKQFREQYPASPLAPKASLAIADFYFYRHQWADALVALDECDLARLNSDDRTLYSYRKALCMIKTGHFAEAKPLVSSLRGKKGYENAYDFYTAYLDYIDGRFNDAYRRFAKVPEGIAGLDAGYYMAQIEYSRGEYDKTISRGTSLLRQRPNPELQPEIERIVGLSLFKLGDMSRAQGYLKDYFSHTPSSPENGAMYAMGAIEYNEGNYNAAARLFEQITDTPDALGQGAWLYLGQCYMKQDNPSSAALAFEKASRLTYDRDVTETAVYNYVTALTRGGKVPFSSSSELLESFVRDYPDSEFTPDVEAYLATAYYNDRNYEKALRYVESIRNPSDKVLVAKQKILYELGVNALTNGEADRAEKYLSQCVGMRRYDRNLSAQASLWLGDAQFSLGKYREAVRSYRAFVKDDTSRENRALGYYDLAYARYKTGDYAGAAADFASALTARPGLDRRLADDATVRRADCLYYTGRYAEALPLYTRAIDDGSAATDYALYRRAVLRGLNGDTKSKLADLSKLEREYPESRWLSKALLEQALTYEETGRSDLAADAYKKRLGVASDIDIDELLRMASAMYSSGRWNDLLDVTERIRRTGGLEADETADIDLYEADALAETGHTEEAVELYARLAANPTSLPGSKAAVMLAENDLRKGNHESARVRMEDFTDNGTPHQYWLARGFIALADAYAGLGQTTLAREYLSSLSENYPGNEKDIRTMISTRLKKWKQQ